jgi:hypothetical protein
MARRHKVENFDTWGNLRGEPCKVIEEAHGENHVKVSIFRVDNAYCYGYQLKVGTLIRQKAANIGMAIHNSEGAAREAAANEVAAVCNTNKNSKKFFEEFSRIRYNQYDLFGGLL